MTKSVLMISVDDVARRKQTLGITVEDERLLRESHDLLQSHAEPIIDAFYSHLLRLPEARETLKAHGSIDTLKRQQRLYFDRLTSGRYDVDYCVARLRVGLVHQRVGVRPETYLGAYLHYVELVQDVLRRELKHDPNRADAITRSLAKIVHFDIGLTLHAYFRSDSDALRGAHEELKRAHAALQQAQDAKALLTDMVVHDLQNPLSGIQGALQWLERHSPLAHDEREAIREALDRCNDMRAMVLDVLQLSRAQGGDLLPESCTLSLRTVAERAARAFRRAALRKGSQIDVDASEDVVAMADPSLTTRILENLLRNGVRHTPKGTQLTVRVHRDHGDGACLSVSDDGPGIPAEALPYLFQPGVNTRGKGALRADSGLGLPFCRIAAEAMGGSIEVASDETGTRFALCLPRAAGATTPDPA